MHVNAATVERALLRITMMTVNVGCEAFFPFKYSSVVFILRIIAAEIIAPVRKHLQTQHV